VSTYDLLNAVFEFGGALVLTLNVSALWRDRKLAGVRIAPTIWYQLWGAWNLVYYFQIGQRLSWLAGFTVFAVNSVWVALAARFTFRPPRSVEDAEFRERIGARFDVANGTTDDVRYAISAALRDSLPANLFASTSVERVGGLTHGRIHIVIQVPR